MKETARRLLFPGLFPPCHKEDISLPPEFDPSTIPPMTVCIAAICEHGKAVVIAADRRVTDGSSSCDNGPDPKIVRVTEQVVYCESKHPLSDYFSRKLERDYLSKLTEGATATDVVDKIGRALQDLFNKNVEDTILRRASVPDIETYPQLWEQFAADSENKTLGILLEEANKCHLTTNFIVASVDGSGANLFISDVQGRLSPTNSPGFVSIGIGKHLANKHLFARSACIKNMSLAEAVYYVYEAKKMSEREDGVGETTDLVILREAKALLWLNEKQMDNLDGVYREMQPPTFTLDKAKQLEKDLRLST